MQTNRNIGILKWHDPLAWMESMKGPAWENTIIKENLHFDTAIQALGSIDPILKKFTVKTKMLDDVFQCNSIKLTPYGHDYKWSFPSGEKREAATVYSEGIKAWAVEGAKTGKEIYTLTCYSKDSILWSSQIAIGPFLAVSNNICYVLETTSELRYGRLVCMDADTGKGRKVLFTEPSRSNNLYLVRGENGCVFLVSNNSGKQDLYHVDGTKVERLGSDGVSFFPVGYVSTTSREPNFFMRAKDMKAPWTPVGRTLRSYMLPKALLQHGIEYFSFGVGVLILSAAGYRTFYGCHPSVAPTKIHEILASIHVEPWPQGDRLTVAVKAPGAEPSIYTITKGELKKKEGAVYARASHHETVSADGMPVPYVIVKGKGKVKGLFVYVYGSYGISTPLSTERWKPYLDDGWAVVFALVRGSGDFGDAWAEAARRSNKHKTVIDTEAVIYAAQARTGLGWRQTCLYGRSAGGYTVGSLVSKYGGGGLVGAAYMEVPYVDGLRTMTNPKLPLTVLEYDEFGHPAERLEDLASVLQVSPVDSLPAEGAPAVFVLNRTSLNDREVLPYESVKWITRLRGFPDQTMDAEEKYLAITSGHGHFVKGSLDDRQRAEDFLLLNAWLFNSNQ